MLMGELIAANWYAPVCSCAGGNYGVLNTFITEKIEHGNLVIRLIAITN